MEKAAEFDSRVVARSAELPVALLPAAWSGPDRVFKPIVLDVLRERSADFDLVIVDVDQLPGIAEKFDVLSIPTLAVFNDGILVARTVGALPAEKLESFLDSSLDEEADLVTVTFPRGTLLVTGAKVRRSGAIVGVVRSVELTREGEACAVLELEPKSVPISQGVTAVERRLNADEPYLELSRGDQGSRLHGSERCDS